MKRNLYLFLTRTDSIFSKAIYYITRDKYTHIAISLDESFREMYSFGRRNPAFALPAGFTREDIFTGFFVKNNHTPCMILKLEVSYHTYRQIQNRLLNLYQTRYEYKYSILGAICCKLGISCKREKHYFCSQFIIELLQQENLIHKQVNGALIRPEQIAKLLEDSKIFEGFVCDLRQNALTEAEESGCDVMAVVS